MKESDEAILVVQTIIPGYWCMLHCHAKLAMHPCLRTMTESTSAVSPGPRLLSNSKLLLVVSSGKSPPQIRAHVQVWAYTQE